MPAKSKTQTALGEPMMSPIEAANYIGSTRRFIYEKIATGELKAYKCGSKNIRIRPEDLAAFMKPWGA